MVDKTSSVELVGTPLGALLTSTVELQWLFNISLSRPNAYIELYALNHVTNAPDLFQWSNAAGGTYNILGIGVMYTLPLRGPSMSYYFKRGGTADVDIYGTVVG